MGKKRKRKRKFGKIKQLWGGFVKEIRNLDSRMADGLYKRETTGIVLARSPDL